MVQGHIPKGLAKAFSRMCNWNSKEKKLWRVPEDFFLIWESNIDYQISENEEQANQQRRRDRKGRYWVHVNCVKLVQLSTSVDLGLYTVTVLDLADFLILHTPLISRHRWVFLPLFCHWRYCWTGVALYPCRQHDVTRVSPRHDLRLCTKPRKMI